MSTEDGYKNGIAECYRQMREPARILTSDKSGDVEKDIALQIIKPLLAVAEQLTGRTASQLIDSTLKWLQGNPENTPT